MHTYMSMHICLSTCIHICICTYTYIYACMSVMCVCMYYIHIYTCLPTYKHICIITYTDMCIHRLTYVSLYTHIYVYISIPYMSHRGGFWTIKSFIYALDVYLQMTESTTNSTSCTFIKQLSNSDLQKMVLQFNMQFTPTMVYTLNNKIKHLGYQFNTHSKQSLCIPS